ncbi:MAG: aspartyl/glutamyl-tRNA amidotransferase subunit C [Spirochaetaceae bacterium]|jgi:aspartyl-tRNA(Asn)/glutamyl-tRNA(Gln) amidotransferase subunit C|nr:aspartyl/glutamyl-tRNA amidotransferase subunit C [Spirochaetaceae bacterium]
MDIEELKTTAVLAHLNMSQKELEEAFPAFTQMLSYFAAMQNADGDTKAFKDPIEGLSSAGEPEQSSHFRGDSVSENGKSLLETGLNTVLIENSEEKDGRFIVVPNVL